VCFCVSDNLQFLRQLANYIVNERMKIEDLRYMNVASEGRGKRRKFQKEMSDTSETDTEVC